MKRKFRPGRVNIRPVRVRVRVRVQARARFRVRVRARRVGFMSNK